MPEQDAPLFTDPGATNDGTVAVTDPPEPPPLQTQDPLSDPRVQLEIERARRETLEAMMRQPQPAAQPAPAPQAPLPEEPLGLLSPQARTEMEQLQLTDPVAYSRKYSDLSARLADLRIQRQAAPIIATQASIIVESFKARRARQDGAIATDIEKIFDGLIREAGDISPLVNMTEAQRENELGMRWEAAKARVLEKRMATPAPKPQPPPIAGDGSNAPTTLKKGVLDDDPFISRMKGEYALTDDQLKELDGMSN